jgi:hypothetical protein
MKIIKFVFLSTIAVKVAAFTPLQQRPSWVARTALYTSSKMPDTVKLVDKGDAKCCLPLEKVSLNDLPKVGGYVSSLHLLLFSFRKMSANTHHFHFVSL